MLLLVVGHHVKECCFVFFLISYTPYLVGRVFCSRFWICVCVREWKRDIEWPRERTHSIGCLSFYWDCSLVCLYFELEFSAICSNSKYMWWYHPYAKTKINKLIQRKHAQTRIHTWTCTLIVRTLSLELWEHVRNYNKIS